MKFVNHGRSCGDSCCLRVQNLSVKIGSDKILKDVNLHIHCGQMVALIGPNGAGKSTFLKAVLGQREYEGVISFSAPGLRHRKPPRIGYVPQSPSFDPGDPVSVADLFACCHSRRPAFLGLSKAMREKVLECLERVHGEDLIDKRVGTLSGGELQRVLLALALEPLPNILILDEPLSGVDVEGQTGLMDMLDEIRKKYDLSILMTTHDFAMLPRYADKVVLIDHAVLCKGSPEDVLSSPEFARTFHTKGGDRT
ncbi:MAG: metal ABC transporter ATP-binding protein [Oscillospiraceae bacterium]|nr:metal ABC transporter ATP-binding protein [Oscillospiraceae bacterium]